MTLELTAESIRAYPSYLGRTPDRGLPIRRRSADPRDHWITGQTPSSERVCYALIALVVVPISVRCSPMAQVSREARSETQTALRTRAPTVSWTTARTWLVEVLKATVRHFGKDPAPNF